MDCGECQEVFFVCSFSSIGSFFSYVFFSEDVVIFWINFVISVCFFSNLVGNDDFFGSLLFFKELFSFSFSMKGYEKIVKFKMCSLLKWMESLKFKGFYYSKYKVFLKFGLIISGFIL